MASCFLHLCNPAVDFTRLTNSCRGPLMASTSSSASSSSSSIRITAKASQRVEAKAQQYQRQHSIVLNRNYSSLLEVDLKPMTSTSTTPTHLKLPTSTSTTPTPLKIGIIGLGEFGQFLAKAFQTQGHDVLATSRSDYSQYCQQQGIQYFPQLDHLCEAQPDVLLLCSSILSTEDVIRGIPFHKLKPNTIIADVLSVKQFPKNLLLDVVPSGFGILCTHPMFGKFSGKNSWEGLRFVYDKVRISSEDTVQEQKCEQFLNIFQDQGCRMVEMSCEEHDRHAAESQFVTHTVARVLSKMDLQPTPIDTKGYETLMELTNNTVSHGSDLYDGLFLYNVNAVEQLEKMEAAFDAVKRDLFGKLREKLTRQMEESTSTEKQMAPVRSTQFLPSSEKVLTDVSSFAMLPEKGNLIHSRDHNFKKQFSFHH